VSQVGWGHSSPPQTTDNATEIYESWKARDAEMKDMAKLKENPGSDGLEEQRLNEEQGK
jgi:hypothetical protein